MILPRDKAARRVAIYARRSRESGDKDVSIAEQVAACRGWCLARGHVVVVVYEECKSGATSSNRPEFCRMIEAAERREFDVLVTWDLSRFGRADNDETGHWRYVLRLAGVEIVHVMDAEKLQGEAGEIVRPVLQAGAHEFLRQTSRATVRGQIAATKRGVWASGSAPLGFRLAHPETSAPGKGRRDARLVVHEPGAVLVRRIFDLYVGGHGTKAIAHALNREAIPAPRGGLWCRSTIQAILVNPVYRGDLVRGHRAHRTPRAKFYTGCEAGPVAVDRVTGTRGVSNPGVVPLLIARETWDRAQSLLAEKRTTPTGGTPALLAGLVRCRACGGRAAVNAGCSRGEGPWKRRWSYFRCDRVTQHGLRKAGDPCATVSVSVQKLTAEVLAIVRADAATLDQARIAAEVRAALPDVSRVDVPALEAKRRKIRDRAAALAVDLDQGDDVLAAALAKLRDEDARLAREIEAAHKAEATNTDVGALVTAAVKAARQLDAPDTPEGHAALRAVLKVFVKRIEVSPAPRGALKPVSLEVYTPKALAFTATGQSLGVVRLLDGR